MGVVSYSEVSYWPLNTVLYVTDFKGNDPKFIYYFLQAIDFTAFNSGSAQPSLNRNHIHPMSVMAPTDTSIQRTIAHILGSLDDKIELLRQTNATLEAMAQALYKSWFVDFDPVIDKALAAGNPIPEPLQKRAAQRRELGGTRKPLPADVAGLFPDRFVLKEELGPARPSDGWVPEGWEVTELEKVVSLIQRGIAPKYSTAGGVPVVNQKCIRGHAIDSAYLKRHDSSQRPVNSRFLRAGDVLVNSTGVGTLGRMAQVLEEKEPMVADSHVTVVRPDAKYTLQCIFGQLMLEMESVVEGMGEGSTGQTELSRKMLMGLRVLIPPRPIQSVLEPTLSSLMLRLSSNQNAAEELGCIRDTLLPKLLSGELRVPEAETLAERVL